MSLLGRIFADDEELGKKDDDRKPGTRSFMPQWSARKPTSPTPWQRRKRTVLYGLIACITLYLFFKNMPAPDHPPLTHRPQYGRGPRDAPPPTHRSNAIPVHASQKPPRPEKPSEAEKHYYDGPIKFYNLAVSLRAASSLWGYMEDNRNVLFAASNLKSASEIIPIACEMANWERNDVHFAFMGRDDMDVDEIKVLNGVDDQCNVNWHDARPDFSPWSSDFRMEVSVSAALGHMKKFMHPQAVITDDRSREDAFFTTAMRAKTFELGKPVIELPIDASESLMWIARLDSSSLAAWHTTYVDILIHAPPHSSGSLLRLLKSIEAADYFGHRRPHLTIELPADIDPPTWAFLKELKWPPLDWSGAPHQSQVTLRHRVPRQADSEEQASIRHVESFYPARPADSHVLTLSPQVELSPLYFHFLMYQLLEYRYSSYAQETPPFQNLMGVSLELPYMHLNDSTMFSPPPPSPPRKTVEDPDEESTEESAEDPTSFLWQAPNSNAALYFGDKWIEFHSFLTSRLASDPSKQPGRRKEISELYPAWLEYLQELMRARGYTMLYPNFPTSSSSSSSDRPAIATLHYELFRPPEEYDSKPSSSAAHPPIPTLNPETETFPTDPSTHPLHPKPDRESTPLTTNLLSLLPSARSRSTTAAADLPLLSHEGNALSPNHLDKSARLFASDFRLRIGRCRDPDYEPPVKAMKADDLFCDNPNDIREGFTINAAAPPPPPAIKDDSEIRQSEFEAHLNRQQGGGGANVNSKGESAAEKAEGGAVSELKKTEDGDAAAESTKIDEGKKKETPPSKNTKPDEGKKDIEKQKTTNANDKNPEDEKKKKKKAEEEEEEKPRGW
ncbi:MAG: hypothetical protein LQ345_004877 [Seirophora villosa]|nr:MAG: hypothetical protein LQ345_004877 [Seirophora villosa]